MKYLLIILLFFCIGSTAQPLYLFGGIDTTFRIPPGVDTGDIEPIDTSLGVYIETFGANPFYRKFFATLTFTPNADSTLITYTGMSDVFNTDFIGKEFVDISRNNLNSGAYPPANTTNGNYWPGMKSCRYSVVTSIVDGKNVYVDFVYNGGDTTTPDTQTSQSGYFFYDNKAAFAASMAAADTIVKLKPDSTYVIKGGFNSSLTKNITYLAPTGESNIKMSVEDPFLMGYRLYIKNVSSTNSFSNTFGSNAFWTIPLNHNYNLVISNINLLAPNYIVESTDMGNMPGGWIWQPLSVSSSSNNFLGGNRTLYGVDTEAEYNVEGSTYGNFVNIQAFISNDGGKIVGDDVSEQDMQYWNILNSTYTAREPFGLKANNRAGNVFYVDSSTISTNSRGRVGDFETVLSFGLDTNGRRNIVTINSDTLIWERIKNEYNWGTQSHNYDIYYNENRWEYYDVNDSNDSTWRLYWANTGSFADGYAGFNTNQFMYAASPVIAPKILRVNEDIPYIGQTIVIDGVTNKKINDTTFQIENIGLQANYTYPGLLMRFWVDTNRCIAAGGIPGVSSIPWCRNVITNYYPDIPNDTTKFYIKQGDSLEYNGVKYGLVARRRYSRSTVLPGFEKVYWVYTVSSPIAASNPTFTVTTSRTEFLLTGTHNATLKAYTMGAYGNLTYSNKTLNTVFRNSAFNGFFRATENGNISKPPPEGPLYLHNRYKIFDNVTWDGGTDRYSEMFGSGLYWRNVKEGYDGKTGPWKVYIINGGNIVAPTQTATNDPVVTD